MESLASFKIFYLDKAELLIRTDCQAIISFYNKQSQNKPSRVRWLAFCDYITGMGIQVKFQHIKGTENQLADTLSRLANIATALKCQDDGVICKVATCLDMGIPPTSTHCLALLQFCKQMDQHLMESDGQMNDTTHTQHVKEQYQWKKLKQQEPEPPEPKQPPSTESQGRLKNYEPWLGGTQRPYTRTVAHQEMETMLLTHGPQPERTLCSWKDSPTCSTKSNQESWTPSSEDGWLTEADAAWLLANF